MFETLEHALNDQAEESQWKHHGRDLENGDKCFDLIGRDLENDRQPCRGNPERNA